MRVETILRAEIGAAIKLAEIRNGSHDESHGLVGTLEGEGQWPY
jgi:hypothetical protein